MKTRRKKINGKKAAAAERLIDAGIWTDWRSNGLYPGSQAGPVVSIRRRLLDSGQWQIVYS